MNYQEVTYNHGRSLAFQAIGNRPLSLSSDGAPSPSAQSWNSDSASSRSPSLYSVPSTSSTLEFPTTPPPDSSLRLPQVPVVPAIRHRTPQACDKCRERKTKCSGHHPICVRCSNRGLKCKYSTRETRIRGGAAKAASSTRSPDGQPHHQGVDANGPGYGRPTPAHHSRMGYSQTSAFTRSPEDSATLEPSRRVYTTSPVGTHCIEEEFGWHTCQDPSKPESVAFPFGVDSWLSLDSNSTHNLDVRAQMPVSLGMPPPGRLNEFPSHAHSQNTFACSTASAPSAQQESGFGYPNPNRYEPVDHAFSTFETDQIFGFSEGSALQPSIPPFLGVAGENSFLSFLANDTDCLSSSSCPRALSAFQIFVEPPAAAIATNNSLDRFDEFAFFC